MGRLRANHGTNAADFLNGRNYADEGVAPANIYVHEELAVSHGFGTAGEIVTKDEYVLDDAVAVLLHLFCQFLLVVTSLGQCL